MVEIVFHPRCLAADGHAADAVGCAAVSAVLYSLAGGLENTGGSRWEIGNGRARIEIPDRPDAQCMYRMAEIGLRQIAAVRKDVTVANAETTAPQFCDNITSIQTRR